MLIDVSQTGQFPYIPLLTETSHTDSIVERAQQWMRKNMAKDVRMSDLARAVAVSERTLVRRFGVAIGQSPLGLSPGCATGGRARITGDRRK
jgi:transcriptional regulator GlxA family with amidase domain